MRGGGTSLFLIFPSRGRGFLCSFFSLREIWEEKGKKRERVYTLVENLRLKRRVKPAVAVRS